MFTILFITIRTINIAGKTKSLKDYKRKFQLNASKSKAGTLLSGPAPSPLDVASSKVS